MDVLNSEEASEDAYIDNGSAALDEEYKSGLVGAGVTKERNISQPSAYLPPLL